MTTTQKAGTGFEVWVVIAAVFLASNYLRTLATIVFEGVVTLRLEASPNKPVTAAMGAVESPMDGAFTLAVDAGELAGSTVAVLVIATAIFPLGLIAASWFLSSGLTAIGKGRDSTPLAIRRIQWATRILLVAFPVGTLIDLFGSNMAQRDLGIDVDNGFTMTHMFVALGIVALLFSLIAVLRRSAAAEAETEGLV